MTIVDTLRLSDAIIAEHDELTEEHGVASIGNGSTRPEVSSIRPRIGSVDSGHPGYNSRPHSRSTSVELRSGTAAASAAAAAAAASKMNSSAAWKQLNDGLNHLFPVQNKKPSLPKLLSQTSQPNALSRPELRKSSSRSSLCDEFELQDINEDQRYHTVTGSTTVSGHGRKNTLVAPRNPMLARPDEPDQQPHRPLSSSPSYPWTTVESRPVLVNGVRGRPGARAKMLLSGGTAVKT